MESQAKQAWLTSLRLLAATPKTRKELEKKLVEKGYSEPIIQDTLAGLEKQGFLSDKAYAKNLLSKLTNAKPSGKRKISFEMKRHGISSAIQAEILEEISEEDETAKARELAELKWAQNAKLEPMKRRKKVFDFLIRRGFDFQTTKDILSEVAKNDNTDNYED